MKRIYLDHNATTPLDTRVFEEMLPFLGEQFGNPSSIHSFGREARRAIDFARQRVADFICADPSEIVFTSGGTEANNHAIRGVAGQHDQRSLHIITSAVEHPAVLKPCRALQQDGVAVSILPVDTDGRVEIDVALAAFNENTHLMSVMLANNDVGTIMPVAELSEVARERGVTFHTDAVQAAGKIPLDARSLGVDLLTISGHKVYGPKGSGALYIKRGTKLHPLLSGGEHERGRRAGTENVAAIVGFGKACELAGQELESRVRTLSSLRDRLEHAIMQTIEGVRINGHQAPRLPNTLNVSIDAVESELLMMNLDIMGIAVSAGSACTSGAVEPSHVLTAMGLSPEEASTSVRFSLGIGNTEGQIDQTVDVLFDMVNKLRGSSPLSGPSSQ